MEEVNLRVPREDDWPAILELAQRSLAGVPQPPDQREWMENRRSFAVSDGVQRHFVATDGERIVGYACIERRNAAPQGWYRLFVVVEPSARATLGAMLFGELRERLLELGARRTWMMEFEADAGFVAFLEGIGFAKIKSLELDGHAVVQLAMDAPFQR
ncbi:MAG TPA: GNAT family N-acetyltransferase [Candidatus Binataceae bacterium]|nr:GNAT family N-acetyltransferase [Candidatus Binataceae bacterium]